MIAWIAAGPFLVISHFHKTAIDFGVLQAFVFGSFITGTRLVKPLMNRFSVNTLFVFVLLSSLVASIFALVMALLLPTFLSFIVIAMMIFSLASGILFPILNQFAMESSQVPMATKVAIFSATMTACAMLGTVYISIFSDGGLITMALFLVIVSAVANVLKLAMKA